MRRWLLLFALVASAQVSAQSCRLLGHVAAGGTTSRNASTVAGAISGVIGAGYTFTRCTPNSYQGTGPLPTCYWNIVGPPPTADGFQVVLQDYGSPGACPEPAACDQEAPGVGETFTAGNVEGANQYCNPVSHCMMNVTSRSGETMTVRHTMGSCSSETPEADGQPSEGEPETCAALGDGEYCASNSGDGNCGYVNDEFVCLSKVKPSECKVLADGGRVCGASASTTPPVPDNGTPGELATPDGTIQHENTVGAGAHSARTINYFSSTTVAGSSRDPGTDGGSPDGGSPGSEEEEGEGLPADCEGDGCEGTLPELEEIGTVGDAFGGFWDDLNEVPFIAAAADVAPTFSGGSCPAWSTSVALYSADIDIDFTAMCGLWTDISPALSIVCLVMFGLLAFRILFSA